MMVFSMAGCQDAKAPAVSQKSDVSPAPVSSPSPAEAVKTQETSASTAPSSDSEVSSTTQEQPDKALTVELKATQEVKAKTPVISPVPAKKTAPQKDKTTAPAEALKGITIKADGFAPSNITISPGTKVIFINMDDGLHWPASGIHPTHQICPGFDALKGLAKNETYTFTFTEAKVCPFHDHLNPALQGKIIVK